MNRIMFTPQFGLQSIYIFVIEYIFCTCIITSKVLIDVGSVVEWLKRPASDQHGLCSKPACAILLLGKTLYSIFPAWWSWQAVLNYSPIFIKLQADSNIWVSPEQGRGYCLPYVLAPPSLYCE